MPFVDVFHSGQDGYASFRIPALCVTGEGTVLAFCEGRVRPNDHAENDIVLRRSTDGGVQFGPLQVVAADGANSLNNPQVIVVQGGEHAGRILLVYQRYPAGVHEREVVAGYEDERACRCFLTTSDDEGATWSEPREITRGVKRPERVTSIAGGPGIGIQLRHGLHAGRIVMPFNEGPFGDWRVYAAFSDDVGETWSYGDAAPEGSPGHGNEVQMVELVDGSILLNSRSHGGARLRKTAVSTDGGASWTPLVDETQLPEPQCMASVLRYTDPADGERSRILYAGPGPNGRRKGRILLSYTEGQTWTEAVDVYRGGFAYSCLGVLPDRAIGCLFERDGYGKISLARVTLEEMTDGRDRLERD
ncbi:MAG: exo-alpha-sialidase [bacterium]|nr:exo-alpha-sialidase [bacterium]